MPSASETLRAAHSELTRRGHAKGTMYGAGGYADAPVCALGAIDAAVGRVEKTTTDFCAAREFNAAHDRLQRWLFHQDPLSLGVAAWNDANDRTADDVLLALKSAAEWDGS